MGMKLVLSGCQQLLGSTKATEETARACDITTHVHNAKCMNVLVAVQQRRDAK